MSYQILPTLIFALAAFAAILMVLRRLPQVRNGGGEEPQNQADGVYEKLTARGLPARAASNVRYHLEFWAKKIWRFMLEAKEMAPSGASVLKIKRLFTPKSKPANVNISIEARAEEMVEKSEKDFLEIIKKEPKNFAHYDDLGKFYLQAENFSDARDIYLYLTLHASGTADYWARLGFASFKLKDYKQSVAAYKKSIALDSSQPNRYYNLAQSLKALGEPSEALKILSKALQMDPQNFKFLELKGRLEKPTHSN